MAAKGDTAGVIAPPPLIFLAGLVAGYGMDYLWPTPPLPFDREIGYMIGAVYGAIGIGVAVAALLGFRRAGTSPEPWHPTSALVVQGIYRRTRNPMYLGMTLIYLGITAAFGGLWMAVTLLPVLVVMHYGVIAREERYLEAKFGDGYRDYTASVRRWF
ncbi:MAG: isoprenylcysteine carboxylmethyltransferase family protein [Rhodospirillaceae bacterium]|nr:isoprenylcysteine carboxylmethyltransferase family protein [Rhodospirillaceae bacterium]MDD9918230.1 isoprenylcysteine carboxylmethyltransferase family protein [Rhodospirillaceae bacterium]MDD9926217.1 isoprenylcysteine carboxylmethyltransferase family protein [Rhodospirillaceae bacterium]